MGLPRLNGPDRAEWLRGHLVDPTETRPTERQTAMSSAPRAERQARFRQLLAERIRAGRLLYQAISHPEAGPEIATHLGVCQRLDARCARWRAWPMAYLTQVMPEEDRAMHTPGTASDCPWCRRGLVCRLEPIPLPTRPPGHPSPSSRGSEVRCA